MEDSLIKNRKKARIAYEDRISKLSDDVIHQILSCLDARLAVQTSILSKRWKLVWTTLPFLNFYGYNIHYEEELSKFIYSKLINHVFSRRNHQSRILQLNLCPSNGLNLGLMKKCVKHAISLDVERLHVKSDRYCSLSTFSSASLRELKLTMKFESVNVMESHCWNLPHLTTLLLKSNESSYYKIPKVPESCLICLPALTTLGLEKCELPESFSLPYLTTLCLEHCTLPKKVWDLPALLTLQLGDMVFPKNMSDYFLALATLTNLAIDFGVRYIGCFVISSSHLVNLKLKAIFSTQHTSVDKIVVLAPKLCNFNAIGFFGMTFEGSELENVNIKFWDLSRHEAMSCLRKSRQHQAVFEKMLSQLGSAKILRLDLMTIQVLSEISDTLVHLHCPFYNLKCLKLPHGCVESNLSSAVRNYLLGGSPSSPTVKPMPRDDVIPQMTLSVSLSTQNVVQEVPSETPTTELIDTGKREEKEHLVENSVVDADKLRQIQAPVAVASNVRASSSGDNSYLVLWRGHEVNSEFVGLLDLIMERYPETFEQLPTENKKIWTAKLNTLCSLVNAFTETLKTEVEAEMLTEYRVLFSDLQRWGFDVNWLISHLNYVEQLSFSKPLLCELHAIDTEIDEAESILQKLHTLRAKQIKHSQSSPTMGTSLAVTAGYIGDDLLQVSFIFNPYRLLLMQSWLKTISWFVFVVGRSKAA